MHDAITAVMRLILPHSTLFLDNVTYISHCYQVPLFLKKKNAGLIIYLCLVVGRLQYMKCTKSPYVKHSALKTARMLIAVIYAIVGASTLLRQELSDRVSRKSQCN